MFCIFRVNAQTDTEFWFAAPEVSTGPSLLDRPVYLRISTTQQASNITILQPANPLFIPKIVEVAANTTITVDLTSYIDMIENKPANKILDYGLLITASSPVSAYYEVASKNCNCNPEIFSLKGRNALGKLFYTPFQNVWDNSYLVSYSPTPYSSFDIVATENNTLVTIIPKNDIVGHSAGESFIIKLNRGQTYSATALSQLAGKHLGGSKISADKPIAVTIKDDLLYYPIPDISILGIDLVGDQIVPVNIIGNEYIVQKGLLYNDEKIFVLATQDATSIYIDGNATPATTINAGDTYTITLSKQSSFIKSNKPIYALHISGFEYELGAALLPKIECNGSQQIGFTRSSQQIFALNLVVKKGSEDGFILNGNSSIISKNVFSPVLGTGGEWLAAQIQFNTLNVPVGRANLLTNTKGNFQMGLIDGSDGGASYGYFSDYATLNLGSDRNLCEGLVILDAGTGKDTYLWSNGSTHQKLTVTDPGSYWVKTTSGECVATDTVLVTGNSAKVNLGEDVILCKGEKIILEAGIPNANYKWQDGSTNATFEVSAAGNYWVEITTSCGTVRDDINISYGITPEVSLGQDQILCAGQQLLLDASFSNATYLWQDGSISPTLLVNKAGTYYVEVSIGSCTIRDEVVIHYTDKPVIDLGSDITLCKGQVKVLSAYSPHATYKWQDGSTKENFEVKNEGTYWVEVTNGCTTVKDEIVITYTSVPQFSLGRDTSICVGKELVLNAFIENGTYLWQDGSIDAIYKVSEAGTYRVEVKHNNCPKIDSITVTVIECLEDLYIPNIFTPNGDNINETFFVKGILLGKWHLQIYNRWGKIIYQSHAYNNDWNGDGATNGVYFYYLIDPSKQRFYKGWVHILK